MSMHYTSISTDRIRPDATKQGPFGRAHNIYLFFGGGDRGMIVDSLTRSLGNRDSELMTVRGEPGSGKTMMSLVLADRMKHRRNLIRFDHDTNSTAALLRHLLIEISPRHGDSATTAELSKNTETPSTDLALQRLWQALQSPLPNDKPFLLIIDSNSKLDNAALVLLKRLAAIRFQQRASIQIVLFEHEVDESSASESSGETARTGKDFTLRRLTLPETGEFLYHQMLCFDFNLRGLFTRDMAYFITERSEGVFSRIKELSRQAMLFADVESANGDQSVMSQMLMSSSPLHGDQPEPRQKFLPRHRGALITLLGLSVVISITTVIALVS